MTSAAEMFIELAHKLEEPEFCAELLSAIGKADCCRIYGRLFEDACKKMPRLGVYSVFSLCDADRSRNYINELLKDNDQIQFKKLWTMLGKKNLHSLKSNLDILLELLQKMGMAEGTYNYKDNFLMEQLVEVVCKMGGEKEAAKILIASLKNPKMVESAALCLASFIKTSEATAALIELDQTNNVVKKFIAGQGGYTCVSGFILMQAKDSKIIKSLLEYLKSGDSDTRRRVAMCFRHVRDEDSLQPVVELLMEALKSNSKDYDLIRWAMLSLNGIAEISDIKLIPLLWEIIRDDEFRKWVNENSWNWSYETKEYREYEWAITLLSTANACEYIMRLLEDENISIRRHAVAALSKLDSLQALDSFIKLLKNWDPYDKGGEHSLFETTKRISKKYYDELIVALFNAYHKEEIDRYALYRVVSSGVSVLGYGMIRNAKAKIQYHCKKENSQHTYIPSLASNGMNKIPDCCKENLKIGDEAIALLNENSEKESIHAPSCPEVKAAYWS